jgi:glutaminase
LYHTSPYINSGAIATAMQLHGDKKERYEGFRQVMSGFCNKEVRLDEGIYVSESSTAARNRAIADKLLEHGICESEFDKEHGLEAYFMMCSTLLNTVDLAVLAATCAHHGQNPISKKSVVDQGTNAEMMSVMMTCGMYNGAGNWMVDVGIPAKSGVSGAIFGVVPDVCGIAVFSPNLNANYNSVRGIEACTALSQRLGLHVLQKKKAKLTFWEILTGTRKPVTEQDVADKQNAKTRSKSTVGRTGSISGHGISGHGPSTVVPSPQKVDWSDDVQTVKVGP